MAHENVVKTSISFSNEAFVALTEYHRINKSKSISSAASDLILNVVGYYKEKEAECANKDEIIRLQSEQIKDLRDSITLHKEVLLSNKNAINVNVAANKRLLEDYISGSLTIVEAKECLQLINEYEERASK